ncbi:MAG: DUF87 domain-containing protein [Rhizobiales bacterium]|nr:DUF87 domain-containing protein [Hyphomicrobiales bacterium]
MFSGGPFVSSESAIGRIVSVTGSKAIVMLDNQKLMLTSHQSQRPEMGTLLGIGTKNTVVLGLVSALSVPVPAQREGDPEIWIAELSLVGELPTNEHGEPGKFTRGVSAYPALGDLVRLATKAELAKSFSAEGEHSIKVGHIRQESSIPAMVKTDDLLGKHFAILGTTGTGKSCTTALILRAILEKNPAAHIVLLDPHNEYATSFSDLAEVITPHNMHLPYWLLTFEELVEVLIGDPSERKHEIELLQELIPLCKSRYGQASRQAENKLAKRVSDQGRFTVDTPVPYRISDLTRALDERMGMLENKKDLSPYRALKTRIETISKDQRYRFMFGSLTVNDSMVEVLSRIFRVPVNGRPITILELTGLPTEIVNVVVSVLCRMTFDFALWGEGRVPVTLVCEEAHRYVPVNSALGFEPAKRSIAKIAKEGRKYGASLCIVTQRPAEIDPTILSQCNTVFALRMSNDRDQEIVQAAISDTGSGLLEFLPALGAREAIAFGDGVTLPVRIKFHELPKHFLPRSSTAKFSEKWQESTEDESILQMVVDRWRASGHVVDGDHQVTDESVEGMEMMSDAGAIGTTIATRLGSGASRQVGQPESGAPRRLLQQPAGEGPGQGLLRRAPAAAGGHAPAQAPAAAGGGQAEPAGEPRKLDLRARLLRRTPQPQR